MGGPDTSEGVQILRCKTEVFGPGGSFLGGSKFFVTIRQKLMLAKFSRYMVLIFYWLVLKYIMIITMHNSDHKTILN